MDNGKNKLRKVARIMVPNGEYTDKDGNTKKRWHEVGVLFATPHHSNMSIKFHADGHGQGQFASVFYDEDCKPNFKDGEVETEQKIDF